MTFQSGGDLVWVKAVDSIGFNCEAAFDNTIIGKGDHVSDWIAGHELGIFFEKLIYLERVESNFSHAESLTGMGSDSSAKL